MSRDVQLLITKINSNISQILRQLYFHVKIFIKIIEDIQCLVSLSSFCRENWFLPVSPSPLEWQWRAWVSSPEIQQNTLPGDEIGLNWMKFGVRSYQETSQVFSWTAEWIFNKMFRDEKLNRVEETKHLESTHIHTHSRGLEARHYLLTTDIKVNTRLCAGLSLIEKLFK